MISLDGKAKDFFFEGRSGHEDKFQRSFWWPSKITQSDLGMITSRGEFESMSAVYEDLPDFVPRPIAVESNASDADIHFYLIQCVDMMLRYQIRKASVQS